MQHQHRIREKRCHLDVDPDKFQWVFKTLLSESFCSVNRIKLYDFSTIHTTNPYEKLKSKLRYIINQCWLRDIKDINRCQHWRRSMEGIITLSVSNTWFFPDLYVMLISFSYFLKCLVRLGEASLPSNAYFPWTPNYIQVMLGPCL